MQTTFGIYWCIPPITPYNGVCAGIDYFEALTVISQTCHQD